ncbi:MAG: aldose epimerase family protein [Thiolinea sp.]
MQIFGKTPSGTDVQRITLSGGGLTANILTLGGALQDLRLEGVEHSLVLGFPVLEPYLPATSYMGPTVGRFANRIANGRARIAGQVYQLDRNFLGKHLLHGGVESSARQVWDVVGQEDDWLTLGLRMADGHMGFPGNLDVELTYRLPGEGVLDVLIRAVTDAATLCNFAHHSYFNLDGSGSILEHELQIAVEHYLPVDAEKIPTGEIASVAGTAFDFRQARAIGQAGANYDHNFCVRAAASFAPGRDVTQSVERDQHADCQYRTRFAGV